VVLENSRVDRAGVNSMQSIANRISILMNFSFRPLVRPMITSGRVTLSAKSKALPGSSQISLSQSADRRRPIEEHLSAGHVGDSAIGHEEARAVVEVRDLGAGRHADHAGDSAVEVVGVERVAGRAVAVAVGELDDLGHCSLEIEDGIDRFDQDAGLARDLDPP
jgi:hypothetical protein